MGRELAFKTLCFLLQGVCSREVVGASLPPQTARFGSSPRDGFLELCGDRAGTRKNRLFALQSHVLRVLFGAIVLEPGKLTLVEQRRAVGAFGPSGGAAIAEHRGRWSAASARA